MVVRPFVLSPVGAGGLLLKRVGVNYEYSNAYLSMHFFGSHMSISGRLREERERLGLNQVEFGAVGGVKKLAQINYEKGERHPDSTYLAAIAAAGADVLYILTGQRTGSAVVPAPARPLAPDEEILLDNYRNCPPDARAAIKTTSAALARASGGCKRGKAA